MSITKGANAHGISVSDDHLKRPGTHNQQWLVEDLFPLEGVEVAWSDDPLDFNFDLPDLGFQVVYPVDARPLWRDCRVTKHGAAALIYGGERVIEGVSGRSIVFDPKRHRRIVSQASDKLFEYDVYGRYRLSQAGADLQRVLLSIEDLRLITFSLFWPFLPNGFGVPGRSIPAWAWLRKLADQTGAAVVVTLDGPEQLKRMWRKGIRLAAERRPLAKGTK